MVGWCTLHGNDIKVLKLITLKDKMTKISAKIHLNSRLPSGVAYQDGIGKNFTSIEVKSIIC